VLAVRSVLAQKSGDSKRQVLSRMSNSDYMGQRAQGQNASHRI